MFQITEMNWPPSGGHLHFELAMSRQVLEIVQSEKYFLMRTKFSESAFAISAQ